MLSLSSACSFVLDFGDDPSTGAAVYSPMVCMTLTDFTAAISEPSPEHPFGIAFASGVWRNDCTAPLAGLQVEIVDLPDGFWVINADPGPANGGIGSRVTVPDSDLQAGGPGLGLGEEVQVALDVHRGADVIANVGVLAWDASATTTAPSATSERMTGTRS